MDPTLFNNLLASLRDTIFSVLTAEWHAVCATRP